MVERRIGGAPTRRNFLGTLALGATGLAAGAAKAVTFPAALMPPHTSPVRPALMARALAALEQHGSAIAHRDVIGIADFSRPSGQPRFHLVDMASGRVNTLLVTHGKGSDPGHSGVLQRFSNVEGSEATSSGAYLTGALYVGQHGQSRRLAGLDASNCNAESRAIVIHGAWYANPDMVRQHGKLGRSQGCLAVGEQDLQQVLARLGAGRLIYADKV